MAPLANPTRERNERIVELYRSGVTLQEIGDRFGVTRERVRQIVARAEGAPKRRTGRAGNDAGRASSERVRLRIGNLAKAVLVTGQAYQDPKDALNEFVSNAADEYAELGSRGERVRVLLRRKGKRGGGEWGLCVTVLGRERSSRTSRQGRNLLRFVLTVVLQLLRGPGPPGILLAVLPPALLQLGIGFGCTAAILGGSFYPLAGTCALLAVAMTLEPGLPPWGIGVLLAAGLFAPGLRFRRLERAREAG